MQNCLLRRSRPQDGKLAHLVFLVEVEKKIRPGATDGGGTEDCDIGRARRLAATPWSKKISKLTSDGVPHSVTDRKVIFSFEVTPEILELFLPPDVGGRTEPAAREASVEKSFFWN